MLNDAAHATITTLRTGITAIAAVLGIAILIVWYLMRLAVGRR